MTLKIAFPTLIAFCFYGFTPTLAQAAEKTCTIAVSGTATTKVAPDMVIWQLATSANHKDLLKAKKKSDKQVKVILKSCP